MKILAAMMLLAVAGSWLLPSPVEAQILRRRQRQFAPLPRAAPLARPAAPAVAPAARPASPGLAVPLDQDKYRNAERNYRRALAALEQGGSQQELAATLSQAGILATVLGKYDDAESYLRRWERLREHLPPRDQFEGLHHLAILHFKQGNYPLSAKLYLDAIELGNKNQLGDVHAAEINLAKLHAVAGNVAAASKRLSLMSDLPRSGDQAASGHYLEARILDVSGLIASFQCRHAAAVEKLKGALAKKERLHRSDLTPLVHSLMGLATAYQAQGNMAGARPLAERALGIQRGFLAQNHFETGRTLRLLALLALDEGNGKKALDHCGQALSVQEIVFDAHPDVADTFHARAIVHWSQGRLDEARKDCQRARSVRQRWLLRIGKEGKDTSDDEPWMAGLLHTEAFIAQCGGDAEKARELFEQAQNIFSHKEHPCRADSLLGLAVVCVSQGEQAAGSYNQDPERLYREWWQLSWKSLDNAQLAYRFYWLATVFRTNGRTAEARWCDRHARAIHDWFKADQRAYGSDVAQLEEQLRTLGANAMSRPVGSH
ncbi:MAG: tetratricopeptide repeat protein [Pirellulales bacterium]